MMFKILCYVFFVCWLLKGYTVFISLLKEVSVWVTKVTTE